MMSDVPQLYMRVSPITTFPKVIKVLADFVSFVFSNNKSLYSFEVTQSNIIDI